MSFRSVRMSWLLLGALTLLPAAAEADGQHVPHAAASEAGADLTSYVAGASRLEGRILAPCCWNQTIDIHGSEQSYQLRREIRTRLQAGESADTIEASLVTRYGSKILAVPNSSPLGGLATLLALAFGGVGVAGYFMLKRWSRAGKTGDAELRQKASQAEPSTAKSDALDARLDRELSEIRDLP